MYQMYRVVSDRYYILQLVLYMNSWIRYLVMICPTKDYYTYFRVT